MWGVSTVDGWLLREPLLLGLKHTKRVSKNVTLAKPLFPMVQRAFLGVLNPLRVASFYRFLGALKS